MSLSIGIVGLPNVGKSTLFNALTKKAVAAENFPFCTIDPSVGVVSVPDERLQKLSDFSQSEKTIPAAVEFVDIAGLVQGAAEGEGLGNQFLSHIREVDAIAEVVRIFEDEDITHVHGHIDPLHDMEIIELELAMADLQTVEKRLQSIEKEVKKGDKDAVIAQKLLDRLVVSLRNGEPARLAPVSEEEVPALRSLQLLTAKPILYILNKKAGGYNLDEHNDERYQKLIEKLESIDARWVVVDAKIEQELSEVHDEDREMFRKELGAHDDGVNDLITSGYKLLGLISFFTTGPKETRAWTITAGSTAPEAGAAIHSDFKDKFIRADVIQWDTLLEAGSHVTAREKGLIRTEGKEYIVQEGDVIEFKI